ncbi:oxidoreductase [Streptomyces cavernicola]|uniref:FAD-dependent oxidoreductase n=1 Tax=Streptomyces cavernicola TaxID=3043613 RepID=A0ABT6SCU2_9ACTN|nr:FAD-dependent oxidoreductase [Streptomyces sp. B-S-A6]MDI3406017.1 FAD-dependent oxidoreductase [Streptomyces sp. B-S-A6]
MLTRLFTPLPIGPATIRNRIVSTGHDTVMAEDGKVTDRLVAYHRARAQGGVGLIVLQVGGVHDSARYTSHALMADTDACVEGYRRLADTAHEHGATLFAQLFHGGAEVMDTADGALGVSYSASTVPTERFRVFPRAMPRAMVREVIDGFAAAARRLRRAGLDGVEIVASHGYLPAQFLNPATNLRTDEYGGSWPNRLRFLREALTATREATGGELAVGVRISLGETHEGGLGEDDALRAVTELDGAGLLDYVSVTHGTSATLGGSDHIVPPMTMDPLCTTSLSRRVKEAVSVPVIVAGRINQPQDAELVLERGDADAVGMTRALICDPEMPAYARRGDLDGIRACIACNQACIGHFHTGHPISCIQRPETGREQLYGILTPARRPRDVLVAGAGPAGLKAAVVASRRGHRVTVYDAGRRPGGQVLLAERLPGRAEFGGAVTNLLEEARRSSVRIKSGVTVDAELVREQAPDAVVLATGARPYRPPRLVTDGATVRDAWEVIGGGELPKGRVLVADWRGDWVGVGVANLLAERGHKVVLATTGYQAGETLQQYTRDESLRRLMRHKVEVVPLVRLYGADDDTAYLQHVLTEEPVLVEGVTSVVLALGHEPVVQLADELAELAEGERPDVHLIGDCLAPRTVEEAVLEGMRIGHAL